MYWGRIVLHRKSLTCAYSYYTLMGMKDRNTQIITQQFYELVKLANEMEKTPRRFGTDEPLKANEIHLIELIGDNDENLSVTDLSRLLDITKGAVSQNLKKLDSKALILKEEDPDNLSRIIVKLTSKGKTAYFAHKHWHETMDGGFKNYFRGIDQERIDFLIEFLDKVKDFMKRAMA